MEAANSRGGARSDPRWKNLPPGPKAPALVQSLRYWLRPYETVAANWRRFGGRFTIRLILQPPIVVFGDPDAIRDIFTGDPETLYGGEATAWLMAPILGSNSLVVLDGKRHRRERRILMPPFHGDHIQQYGRTIQRIADEVIDSWPVEQPFLIMPQMQTIALEVILQTVFGLGKGARLARLRDGLVDLLRISDSFVAASINIPALRIDLGPRSPWGRFTRARAEVAKLLAAEIARLREQGAGYRTDIFAMLVAARDEHGEPLGEQELFDQMFTLLTAGYLTTAVSLAWIFHHVLLNPDVLEKLRAELRQVAGGGPLKVEQLGGLHYLEAVIRESARLTPITTDVIRMLKQPARIGGIDLPAGVQVSGSIYLAHHNADVWPDPERFDPERMMNVRASPYTLFPYGGGERRCLGATLANYEMKVVVARVLSRADLCLAPGHRMQPRLFTITVAPIPGVPVIMDRPAREP